MDEKINRWRKWAAGRARKARVARWVMAEPAPTRIEF
jgi:hypothetical protein